MRPVRSTKRKGKRSKDDETNEKEGWPEKKHKARKKKKQRKNRKKSKEKESQNRVHPGHSLIGVHET